MGSLKIKPHLMPVTTESSVLMMVATVYSIRFGYLLDLWRRYMIKRNVKIIFCIKNTGEQGNGHNCKKMTKNLDQAPGILQKNSDISMGVGG